MGNSCGKQQEQQQQDGAAAAVKKWGAGGRRSNGGGNGALPLPVASPPSAASARKKQEAAAAAAAGGRAKARTRRGSTMATARALLAGGGATTAAATAAAPAAAPTGPVAVAPPPPPPPGQTSPGQAGDQKQQQQPQRRQRGSSCSDEAETAGAGGAGDEQAAAAATASLAPAAAAVGGLVLSKLRGDCAVRDAYKLGRTLGKGGFAVVRVATDRLTGVDWAVKVMALPRQGAVPGDNDNTIEDVLKEIEILCGLSHPNVVALREYFAERGRVYLVTELVTGGELLGAVLARGACGERDARVAFTQLMRGIEYLHSRGVVHRDLKLENLLLSKPGQLRGLKIADFGLARRVPGWGGGGGVGGAFGGGTMSTVCGTPQYVAPEVIAGIPGLEYGPKVDAWSAGVVLFVLLGGYPPFWAESEPALFGLVRRGLFTFDAPVWAGVSGGAKDLIRRLLVVDPARRLSAAEALQHPWIVEGLADVDAPEGEEQAAQTGDGVGALLNSALVPGAALPPIQSERGEA